MLYCNVLWQDRHSVNNTWKNCANAQSVFSDNEFQDGHALLACIQTSKMDKTTLYGRVTRNKMNITVTRQPKMRKGDLVAQCVVASYLGGWQITTILTELHKQNCARFAFVFVAWISVSRVKLAFRHDFCMRRDCLFGLAFWVELHLLFGVASFNSLRSRQPLWWTPTPHHWSPKSIDQINLQTHKMALIKSDSIIII